MSTTIKKELVLEGLCCGNCATKIEQEVSQLTGITTAQVNFVTKILSIESMTSHNIDEISNKIITIVKRHEPNINVIEKVIPIPGKKVLFLSGLNCADCAQKIEREVQNIEGIKNASIDFVQQKLTIEVNQKQNLARIVTQAKKIATQIEPDLKIINAEAKNEAQESNKIPLLDIIGFGISLVIFTIVQIIDFPAPIEIGLFLLSYILVGGEVLIRAGKNIIRGQVFDENFLMGVATIGAFFIGEFPEGVAVMLFYKVGEFFEDRAVNHSRKSINALLNIRPDYANLKIGNEIERVSPEDVSIGDLILVKPGEKVPLDGCVIEGKSMLDTSALTGESIPRDVEVGSEVLSGSININGVLTIEVKKEFGDSTVSRILDLVQNASSKKAPTENFITKFAKYYTPTVVITAVLLAVLPPLILPNASFSEWINRALVFLVVSCPCALVISIPLGFFGGIGGASRNGILIKGSNYLEALNNVEIVVFDKTGTLTKGVFKVSEIHPMAAISQEQLLEYAAIAESFSNHPIATSILKAYGKEVNKGIIEHYDEISGHGIKLIVQGKVILVGNTKLMNAQNITYDQVDATGTVIHLAIDSHYAGYIIISDEIKEDSKEAIKSLRKLGIKKLVMLTGDSKSVGEKIAETLDMDEVYSELLPDQKAEKLEALELIKTTKGKLVFVGDGINDAPVLARADIGIAMGALGSDAAIESADIVLMTDEPSKLVSAIKIAYRTRSIVMQNIIFALGIKLIVILLGAFGIATMWAAVFADVGVAVIAILNAMRVMNVEKL